MQEKTVFYVKDKFVSGILAILEYDRASKQFALHIQHDLKGNLPIFLRAYISAGMYDLTPEQSIEWVRNRVVPSGRANIGEILGSYGLTQYDEFDILRKTQGRCPQDDLYLEEVRTGAA